MSVPYFIVAQKHSCRESRESETDISVSTHLLEKIAQTFPFINELLLSHCQYVLVSAFTCGTGLRKNQAVSLLSEQLDNPDTVGTLEIGRKCSRFFQS